MSAFFIPSLGTTSTSCSASVFVCVFVPVDTAVVLVGNVGSGVGRVEVFVAGKFSKIVFPSPWISFAT